MNDLAGVIPPEREAALEARLARYEAETTHQIVVLTVPSLEGDPIEDFSIRVADAWKIGHKGLDDGIIVIVAPQDRAARIEVGRGLEGVVPDAIASRILDERMLPPFRAGRLPDGIEAGLDALMAAAKGEVIPPERRPVGVRAPARGSDPFPIVIMGALIGSFFAIPFRRKARPIGALLSGGVAGLFAYLLLGIALWAGAAALLGVVLGLFGGPNFGARGGRGGGWGIPGGFGGGGGGFGGGGGGFAGGGASGRW